MILPKDVSLVLPNQFPPVHVNILSIQKVANNRVKVGNAQTTVAHHVIMAILDVIMLVKRIVRNHARVGLAEV